MANIPPPPTTFRELLTSIPDAYNGVYHPLLAAYAPDGQLDAAHLLHQTITRIPVDQVPSVFMYQDPFTTIRFIHHLHKVVTPLGQPDNPLTDKVLGFSGEVFQG